MKKNTDLKKEVKYYKWKNEIEREIVWRKGTMDEM